MVNPRVHKPVSRHGHEISSATVILSKPDLNVQQALELAANIQGRRRTAHSFTPERNFSVLYIIACSATRFYTEFY